MAGSSIERTNIDLLEAYAIRSPLESLDRGVGDPRVVLGEAAQMASARAELDYHTNDVHRWQKACIPEDIDMAALEDVPCLQPVLTA